MAGFFRRLLNKFTGKKEVEVPVEEQSIEDLLTGSQERLLNKPKEEVHTAKPDPVHVVKISPPKKVCDLEQQDPQPRAKFSMALRPKKKCVTGVIIYHMPNLVTGLNAYESDSEA